MDMQLANLTSEKTLTPKQRLNNYLSTFQETIELLFGDNIVIGGMQALHLHGLVTNRKAVDLDLIIYSPTPKQKDVLLAMAPFQVRKEFDIAYGTVQRSYKFKKDGLFLDILVEDTTITPEDLLLIQHTITPEAVRVIKIQSITNVIKAKNSYHTKRTSDQCIGHQPSIYVRDKDVRDLIDLKNSNFNLND